MNKKIFMATGLFLTVACFGVSAGIITAQCLNKYKEIDVQEITSETSMGEPKVEVSQPKVVALSTKDITKLPKKDFQAVRIFTTAPLPEKYMSNLTSTQGLRAGIKAVDAGGAEVAAGFHNAKDYACPEGTPVFSMKEGYVRESWPSYYNGPYEFTGHPSYGGYIEVVHPDHTISRYAHLSYVDVKEGQYVTEGQQIGRSGGVKGKRGSGKSTGPHLHVETDLDMDIFTVFTNFVQ